MMWNETLRRTVCQGAMLAGLAVALPALAAEGDVLSEAAEAARLAAHAACVAHREAAHGADTTEGQWQAMRQEFLAYQQLAEETLTLRAAAIALKNELREKLDGGGVLSGRDLQRINQGAVDMLAQREALLNVSLAHECWLAEPMPTDPERAALRAMGVAMSLSAALILYDNYLSAISLYRADPVLRRHLNRADSGFQLPEGELNKIAASFASADNRARVRRGLTWFETYGQPESADVEGVDKDYRYLLQLIAQSPSRHLVGRARPVGFVGNLLGMFSTLTFDTFLGLKSEGTHVSSLLFGNAVGLVESRRGRLDGQPEVLDKLKKTARAGDILLEKTPFRLTDTFIPGHWGHVAVWVGTEDELRALDLWEHPVVRPHQAAIRAGRGVVEALRPGVVMNTLEHFLNIDDLAVLRQNEMPAAQQREVILQALRQVGKGYDFNFDVMSTDRIVCSELVYHTYVHLDWPTKRMLGRSTISPDNVAVRATRGGPLNVALLYHDGKEIAEGRDEAMERFVKARMMKMARRE